MASLITAVILVSFSAFAEVGAPPEYELFLPQNPDYRDWTPEELRNRTGASTADLERFHCDGTREFELLTPTPRPNPRRDSLRIRGADADARWVYRDGEWYGESGAPARLPNGDRFLTRTAALMGELERLPTARRLLRILEESPHGILIESGRPSFVPSIAGRKRYSGLWRAQALQAFVTLRAPEYPDLPLDAIGAGGYLSHDPNLASTSVEADGVARVNPPHVILAHEMYHAYDSVRGTLDRRLVWSRFIQQTEVSEVRASFFENRVRAEAGLRFKKYYGGGDSEGPGLLDDRGAPIALPAPCLR